MKHLKVYNNFPINESEMDPQEMMGKDEMPVGPNLQKLLNFLKGKTFVFSDLDLVFEVGPHAMTNKIGYTNYEIPGRVHESIINLRPIEDIRGRKLTDKEIRNYGRYYLLIYKKDNYWAINLENHDQDFSVALKDKYPSIYNKLSKLCDQYKLQDDEKPKRTYDFE